MDQPVHGGQRHRRIGENLAPCTKWLIGGEENGAAFITSADELEQNRGFRLILADIGKVIKLCCAQHNEERFSLNEERFSLASRRTVSPVEP